MIGKGEYSALMRAAAKDDVHLINKILEVPNVIDEVSGWNESTALMTAASKNCRRAVEILLSKGADVNKANELKNTAIMLAASGGHLEIAKMLGEHGGDMSVKNVYGQTALILATESGHLNVVQWIAQKNPGEICVRNNYDKNALLVASEFGQSKIVKYIVENFNIEGSDPNCETKKNITALMFASGGTSKGHSEIVDILLAQPGIDVDHTSVDNDTALIRAAIAGSVSTTKKLIKAKAQLDSKNKNGMTALMCAAQRGHGDVVKYLLENSALKWLQNKSGMDAMKIALMHGHVGLVAKYFMRDGAYDCLSVKARVITSDDDLNQLAKLFSNPNNTQSLRELSRLAAIHDFFFDLFVELIPRLPLLNHVLNKSLPIFYETLKSSPDRHSDVDLVDKLVHMEATFSTSALRHPLERMDLESRSKQVERMIQSCAAAECMDNEMIAQAVVCRERHLHQSGQDSSSRFEDDLVEKAQAFLAGPLEKCVRHHLVTLFASGQISIYVDNLFWGTLRQCPRSHITALLVKLMIPERSRRESRIKGSANWFSSGRAPAYSESGKHVVLGGSASTNTLRLMFSKNSENIRWLKSDFIFFRYRPASMFFGECVAKLITLALVSTCVDIGEVTLQRKGFAVTPQGMIFPWWEIWLMVMSASYILYEFGELCTNSKAIPSSKDVMGYVMNIWNLLDAAAIALVFTWFILKLQGDLSSARVPLALSAIFLSLGMLRYLSVNESLGELVIMVLAMAYNLLSFAWVWMFCVFGFGVAMFSIFRDLHPFKDRLDTFVTLFIATINAFDPNGVFAPFRDHKYAALGITVVICFILISGVVLMSLIVANMVTTHDEVDERIFQEWQHTRASIVKQFLLVEEKNPMAMLPPPLNLIPTLLYPFHYAMLQKEVSPSVKAEHGVKESRIRSIFGEEDRDEEGNSSSYDHSKTALAVGMEVEVHYEHHNCWFHGTISRNNQNGTYDIAYPANAETMSHHSYLSLAGTASDILSGLLVAFFAPWLELGSYIYSLYSMGQIIANLTEMIVLTLAFPVIYVLYVPSLIVEVLSHSTRVHIKITNHDHRRRYIVDFKKKHIYSKPHIGVGDNDLLTIKVLRGELSKCSSDSNPIVKVRIGEYEAESGPSMNGGHLPQWSKAEMIFPIRDIDLKNPVAERVFNIEVVDRDPLTGMERVVAHFKDLHNKAPLKKWIANGRFEGAWPLDDERDSLNLVVKANFPSFLSQSYEFRRRRSVHEFGDEMDDHLISVPGKHRIQRNGFSDYFSAINAGNDEGDILERPHYFTKTVDPVDLVDGFNDPRLRFLSHRLRFRILTEDEIESVFSHVLDLDSLTAEEKEMEYVASYGVSMGSSISQKQKRSHFVHSYAPSTEGSAAMEIDPLPAVNADESVVVMAKGPREGAESMTALKGHAVPPHTHGDKKHPRLASQTPPLQQSREQLTPVHEQIFEIEKAVVDLEHGKGCERVGGGQGGGQGNGDGNVEQTAALSAIEALQARLNELRGRIGADSGDMVAQAKGCAGDSAGTGAGALLAHGNSGANNSNNEANHVESGAERELMHVPAPPRSTNTQGGAAPPGEEKWEPNVKI